MSKFKKIYFIIFGIILFIVLSLFVSFKSTTLSAIADTNKTENNSASKSETIEPRIWTSLSISLNGGNDKVWATVKNDFTLFPSTVVVIVQLYCSDNYVENYTEMNLVSQNSTQDLDIGKTIVTEASTNGEVKYWIGRMRYKIDNKNWEERIVGPLKYDANGKYIGVL